MVNAKTTEPQDRAIRSMGALGLLGALSAVAGGLLIGATWWPLPNWVGGMLFVAAALLVGLSLWRRLQRHRRRLTARLQESEDRWRQLVNEHPDPICVTTEGRIRYINPSGARVFGAARPEELIGTSVMEFVPPDMRETMEKRLRQIERGEPTESLEHRTMRLDGKERIVVTRSVPVTYHGEPAAQTVIRDVTEQRRAEQALAASQGHLRAVLEQMPAGLIIAEAPSGRIVQYNQAAEQLLGHPQLASAQIEDYEQYNGFHPDGTPYRPEDYPTARALRGETVLREEITYRRDGVDTVILSVNAAPIRGEDGQILSAVCTFRDVTERHCAEQAVRESEALYETLFHNYPFGAIVVYDHDLRYILAGGEGLEKVGLDAKEMVGKTIWEVFPPETCERIEPDYRKALAGETATSEVPYKGQVYITRNVPIRDEAGTIIAGMVVTMNITQRKKAEEELKKSKALLEETQRITRTGGWELDVEAQQLAWTQEMRRIYEVPSDFEPTPEGVASFCTPASRIVLERAVERAIKEKESFDIELELVTAQKRRIWVEMIGEPEVEEERVARVTGTIRDITKQKSRNERLRLLEAAVENANDVVIVTTADTLDPPGPRIVYVNGSFEKGTGYTRREALGRSPRFLQGEDTDRTALDRIRQALGRAEAVREEVLNYRKDGTPYWVDLSIVPVTAGAEDESPTHYLSVQRDITERKQAEQALQRSEERFRGVSEQAVDVVAIFDADGGFRYLSPSVEEVTGYPRDALIGADGFEPVHPEDLAAVRDAFARAVQDPTSTVETAARYRHKDGSWRHLSIRGRRLSAPGQGVEVLANVRDVTEQIRREQALIAAKEEAEEMSQRYEMALLGGDLGFWDLDLNAWTNVVNDRWAEMLGYTLEEVSDHQAFFESRVHPEDLARAYAMLERHARGEIPLIDLEIRMRHKDGTWRWILDRGRVTEWNEDGSPRRAVGTHMDITERKQRERELISAKEEAEEMNRLKSVFLANMSHEVRTPLTSIIGFADVLEGQVDSQAQELLEMIRVSGERLERTLTSVLDLAQLESQTMTLRPQLIDLGQEVREAASMFRVQAEQKRIDWTVDAPDTPVMAFADRDAIHRVLTNLLSNALKFTHEGQVRVCVAADADVAILQVEDTGVGISAGQLDYIFDEFIQASQGYTRDYEGSGLGLTISRRLVEMMGGTINAESTEGEGAVFTVQLPRAAPPDNGSSPASSADENELAGSSVAANVPGEERASSSDAVTKEVLFVEDNKLTREVVPLLLEGTDAPYTLDVVATADEALEKAQRTTYDLFIIDINLGTSTTGIDVMEALRETSAYASVPMIACTAYAMPGDDEAFLRAGFDAYLAKPFRKEELLATMRDVLRKAQSS